MWSRDAGRARALAEEMAPRLAAPDGRGGFAARGRRGRGRDRAGDGVARAGAARAWMSATARTSARSARAVPISARWTRRSSRDARVFVDSRAGALAEAGDIVIPIREGAIDASHIAGELGDVFGGRTPGRRNADEITLFKSLGMAVEDVAAAHLAFDRATERGLGRGFVLECLLG